MPSNKSEAVVIISVGSDALMNIWSLEAGSEPSVHTISNQHNGPIYTCAHDGIGTQLATGSSDTTIRLYDAETGTPTALFGTMGTEMTSPDLGHSSTVACIEFHNRQPHMLLSAGWDSSFKLWDTRKSKPCVMTTENCHTEIVSCLTALGDHYCVTGSSDSTVKVWDNRMSGRVTKKNRDLSHCGVPSARCVQTLNDHITSICSLSMCAGDAQLITTGGDRTVRQFTSCVDHNSVEATCASSCLLQ
jgi:WD40 repeat protein